MEENIIEKTENENSLLLNTQEIFELYKTRHRLAFEEYIHISNINTVTELFDKVINFFENQLHFEKAAIININADNVLLSTTGYTDEQKNTLLKNKDALNVILKNIFKDDIKSAIYIDQNNEFFESISKLIFLSNILVFKIVIEEKDIYIIAGFDKVLSGDKSTPLISANDTYWFSELSFVLSLLISQINLKMNYEKFKTENLVLKDEHDKKIEERTRSLLDALSEAKKYRLALELADIIVILVDASSHKIIYANELFEKTTGYVREKIVLRKNIDILKLVPLEIKPELFSEDFDKLLKVTSAIRGNYISTTELGNERELTLSISRFSEEGGGSLYVVIGRDVTDERDVIRKEKQHAADIEKLNQLIVNRELRILELKQRITKFM